MSTIIISVPGTDSPSGLLQGTDAFLLDDTILWDARWAYDRVGPKTKDRLGWSFQSGRWPTMSGFCQDPANPHALIMSLQLSGHMPFPFEPPQYGDGGCAGSKFIMGTCRDQYGSPIGGAVVRAFRKDDGLFAGQAQTDGNGKYEVPCPNTPNDKHYLVAYYDSATPLGGVTTWNLYPTWRDGTT